jgi:hypothetical protein
MVYPLLILLISKLAISRKINRNRIGKFFVLVLIIWYATELLLIYPNYFVYFNQFIGGPKNGYKYLGGSSIDFGQDRDTAREYFEDNQEVKVNPEAPVTGRLAVSVNFLNLCNDEKYWLRRLKKEPAGFINYSWLIYNISSEDLESLNRYIP